MRNIKVFGDKAKGLNDGDLMQVVKKFPEGHDLIIINPIGKTMSMSIDNIKDEISYMVRKTELPESIIRQVHYLFFAEAVISSNKVKIS